MTSTLLCLVLSSLGLVQSGGGRGKMKVLHSWYAVDFLFPSDRPRESYIESKEFIPGNNLILDVDVLEDTMFVTIPQFRDGTPVTLATVTGKKRNRNPLLKPYPDWSWHQGDCDGITSVFRTQVDECGRLWMVDTGLVNITGRPRRKCPPQILVFDVHTDSLIRRHRFPDSVLGGANSMMITVKVDTRTPDCSDSVAYMADVLAFQMFVYDFALDKSWRITNRLFYPYPPDGRFHIDGVEFDLMDGIFGLALGPLTTGGDRTLYFHSLASVRESWVSTSVVRNSTLFAADPGASPKAFLVSPGTRPSQSAAQDMTEGGVLLYSLVEENAIGCWNTRLPFNRHNLDIVAKDEETLQFQSGLKVYGDKVYTLSSRYQNYHVNKVPENEILYRINVGTVSDLLKNTKCDPQKNRI